jgi:hypothetical protein
MSTSSLSGDQNEATRPDQKSSPPKVEPKSKALQQSNMNLPNGPVSAINTRDIHVPMYTRYNGTLNTADTVEAGHKYAEQGLMRGIYNSFAKRQKHEQKLLQEENARLFDDTEPTAAEVERWRRAADAKRSWQFDKSIREPYHPSVLDDKAALAVPVAPLPSADNLYQNNDESSKPSGKWRCCKCKRGHEVYTYTHSQHPVSVVSCDCTHRSCSKCSLEGLVKQYVPMSEPEVVPLSEDRTKAIRFGVFCDGCGTSWRAEEVKDQGKDKTMMKTAFQRISAVPRRLTKRGGPHPHPLQKLRASQSMNNLLSPSQHDAPTAVSKGASKSTLNLRALSNEMEKEHGEQAKLVSVKFAGIQCTCGMTTDTITSLCFQIVDPPKDFHAVQFAKQMAERNVAGFGSTADDKEKGHSTPTLTLKNRIQHPNPLMSNPVS